jgi:hypothetical protein
MVGAGKTGRLSRMKFTGVVVGIVLVLIVCFPPVDYVTPATRGYQVGDTTTAGQPERRINRGFVFIGNVGGPVQIRYGQWFVQLGMTVIVGAGSIWIASRPKVRSSTADNP